jgi:hypothetical protein
VTDQTTPLAFNTTGTGWHLQPRRRILFVVLGLLGAAVFVLGGVAAVNDGKYLAAGFMLVVGVAFALLPMPANRRRLPARRYDGEGGPGLLLPVHPSRVATIVASGVIGTVLTVAGVGMTIEGVTTGELGQAFGSLLTLLLAVLLLLGSCAGVRSRMATDRGLVLTPGGVLLRTRRVPATVAWEQVSEVRAHWHRRVKGAFTSFEEPIHNWLTFELRDGAGATEPDPLRVMSGTTSPTLDAATLAVDPWVVLDLARFYLHHPEARAELATDAGAARLESLRREREMATTS